MDGRSERQLRENVGMKRHVIRLGVTVAVAFAVTVGLVPRAAAQGAARAADPTPRMSNGKPDLSGNWNSTGGGGAPSRRCAPGQGPCDLNYQTNQSWDQEFTRDDIHGGDVWVSGRIASNRPLYKPEHWDRIQFLDENTNTYDPILQCQPQGITRENPPTKILQTAS
jgi:hypothetical protein